MSHLVSVALAIVQRREQAHQTHHVPSASGNASSSVSPKGFIRLRGARVSHFRSVRGHLALSSKAEWQQPLEGPNLCSFLPEASRSTYLLPLFWSRNSVAGSTISNWMGVPGAISSSASGTLTAALGTVLSFFTSEFSRFWLEYRREEGKNKSLLILRLYNPVNTVECWWRLPSGLHKYSLENFIPWLKSFRSRHYLQVALLQSILHCYPAHRITAGFLLVSVSLGGSFLRAGVIAK